MLPALVLRFSQTSASTSASSRWQHSAMATVVQVLKLLYLYLDNTHCQLVAATHACPKPQTRFCFLDLRRCRLIAAQWLALIPEPGRPARFCGSFKKNYPCLSAAAVPLPLSEKMTSAVSELCGADLLGGSTMLARSLPTEIALRTQGY